MDCTVVWKTSVAPQTPGIKIICWYFNALLWWPLLCMLCDISSDFFIISSRFEAAHGAGASLGLSAAPGRVNRRAAFKEKHIRRPLLAYFRFADGAPPLLRGCGDFLRTQTV